MFEDLSRLPNLKEFKTAIGLAPIVKISLNIPPTPVAAPWKGSIAEGWLWLSILKTSFWSFPTSITPAFSPGPTNTFYPVIGKLANNGFEFL